MIVIKQPSKFVIDRLEIPYNSNESEYRLSMFCVSVDVPGGKCIMNSFTKACVYISNEEFEHIYDKEYTDYRDFLKRNYFLVEKNYNEFDRVSQLRKSLEIPFNDKYLTKGHISEFTILTTTSCNANCFYCYEKGRSRKPMTIETAEKIVNYIKEYHIKGQPIQLRWFGGEPLFNMKVIDHIVNGVKDAGIVYNSSMISNGYLFDDNVVKKAKELWNLNNVQITLDGTEKTYNKVKDYIYKDGPSPFKKVIDNIDKLIHNNIGVSVRMNMDTHNAENLKELIHILKDKFGNNRHFSCYVYPLFEEFEERTEEHRAEVYKKLEELHETLDSCGFMSNGAIKDGIRSHHCMCDNGRAVLICPDGDIGLCEHYSESEFWGHVDNPEIKDMDMIKSWKVLREPLEICKTCAYYPDCVRLDKCVELRDCSEYIKRWRLREQKYLVRNVFNLWCRNNPQKFNAMSQPVITPCEIKKESLWQKIKNIFK